MTSDEIKKALECCSEHEGCHNCPCKKECGDLSVVTTEALNLINRQKAEIERLKSEQDQFADISKMYSEIKSEAIKEFMDSLKAKAQNANTWTGIELVVTISDIEDTAKEMAGENNGK